MPRTEDYYKNQEYFYGKRWDPDAVAPTPSGSNFGNTITGAQDIYSKELPGPDPSLFTINPGGGAAGQGQVWMAPPGNYGDGSNQTSGGSGEKPWWYSGADTYESEVAKMGQPSTNMGGTPSGGSYGSSGGGMTLSQAYGQKAGIDQSTYATNLALQQKQWETQQTALQKQWEDRFKTTTETQNKTWAEQQAELNKTWESRFSTEQNAATKNWQAQQDALNAEWEKRFKTESTASDKTWADRFAATNTQWAEQAKTSQALSQETWDKQYVTMQEDWDAKFGKTNEAERAKWAEQFAAANTEWERRYNIEKNKVTTTTPVAPPGDMPAMGEAPTFAAPVRDQARIKELTSQKSAAGLRAMRAQIQKAMGQGYRNPNVKRMTLRDALAGYGQGIESVMTGAQTAASGEYQTEYASAYDVAAKNWQTAYQGKMQDWTNKVNDYFKKYGTQTTTA